jgi:hypothetical protein
MLTCFFPSSFPCSPYGGIRIHGGMRNPLRAFGGHKHVEQQWGAGLPGTLPFATGVEQQWGAGMYFRVCQFRQAPQLPD